jgi:putative flippase GtrA
MEPGPASLDAKSPSPSHPGAGDDAAAVAWVLRVAKRLLSLRLVRFGVVGASGVVVNLGVAKLVMSSFAEPFAKGTTAAYLSLAAGIVVSIFSNFVINDAWTWGDRDKAAGLAPWLRRCGRFYVTSAAAATLQGILATAIYRGWHPIEGFVWMSPEDWRLTLSGCVAIVIAMPLNFIANHFWTFRRARR